MHEVEDLNVLIAHYYPCLSSDIEGLCKQRRCQQQWRKLRNEMWETKESDIKSLKTTRTADFFAEWLNTLSPNGRDEICELVQMFCVIVLSSELCERIFSCMNHTKTSERSRMLTDLLNDLMMIKMNGPDCEGIGDQRGKDIIDRAFAELHLIKDRQSGRSRCDARPDQKRKATDIKERISMPNGVKSDQV